MRKLIFLLVLIICSCSNNEQSNKIPLTTTSEKAREYYQKAREYENLQQADSANLWIDKALEEDSTFAIAYMMKGMLAENFDIRRNNVLRAMELLPTTTQGEQLWIKARNDYYGSQEGDSSEYDYFKKLVALYPEDPYANYLYGFVNHHHGNNHPDSAIVYLRKAVSLKEDFSKALEDLVYAYMEKGDFENAEIMATRYVDLLPNLAGPRDTYAEILMRLGKHQESIDSYKKALELDPENAWSHIGIAANLNYLDRHAEARKELDKLDEIVGISDYNFRHKWRGRVVSYLDEGKIDSAIQVLENQKQLGLTEATTHEPLFHAFMSYQRKIDLLYETGKIKEGRQEYREWLEFVENNLTREATLNMVRGLESYYTAYEHFYKAEYHKGLNQLKAYKEGLGSENDRFKRLKTKILFANGQDKEVLQMLDILNKETPYDQYLASTVLESLGEVERAGNYMDKVISTYLIDDIELALVRGLARIKNSKNE